MTRCNIAKIAIFMVCHFDGNLGVKDIHSLGSRGVRPFGGGARPEIAILLGDLGTIYVERALAAGLDAPG